MSRCFSLFLWVLCLSTLCVRAEILNVWTGRDVTLPERGVWKLSAENGELLASGNGDIRFHLPALESGTARNAVLTLDGKPRKLRLWSPEPLAGVYAGMLDLPEKSARLLFRYGLPQNLTRLPVIWFCRKYSPEFPGRLFFLFPEKGDFPLVLKGGWPVFSLRRTEIPGSLGASCGREAPELNLLGDFGCAVLRDPKRTVVVFSPGFDLEKLDNVILIRQLILESSLPEPPVRLERIGGD